MRVWSEKKMCFTMVVWNKNGIGKNGYAALLNGINANKSWNKDGYAIGYTDYNGNKAILRTMDENQYFGWIGANKEKIKSAKLVQIHLRKSTNTISEKYIHMWEFGKHICSHNGIVSKYSSYGKWSGGWSNGRFGTAGFTEGSDSATDKSEGLCDSYEFFKNHAIAIENHDLQSLAKAVSDDSGSGVFFMVSIEKPQVIAISESKPVKLMKNGDLVILASDQVGLNTTEDFCGIAVEKDFLARTTLGDKAMLIDLETMTMKTENRVKPTHNYSENKPWTITSKTDIDSKVSTESIPVADAKLIDSSKDKGCNGKQGNWFRQVQTLAASLSTKVGSEHTKLNSWFASSSVWNNGQEWIGVFWSDNFDGKIASVEAWRDEDWAEALVTSKSDIVKNFLTKRLDPKSDKYEKDAMYRLSLFRMKSSKLGYRVERILVAKGE